MEVNKLLKLKTLSKLINTSYDEEIEEQKIIGSYENDITLDQLLNQIKDMNYETTQATYKRIINDMFELHPFPD